jgi:two-component system, sensor histidine kinase and response regulator
MNLVGNSIKFTEKGHVKIKTQLIEETDSEVVIKFSVKDSGMGIKKDQLQKNFNRYEQAEGCSTFTKYGVTGLGLNISKSLVELHGGEIKVESILGQG